MFAALCASQDRRIERVAMMGPANACAVATMMTSATNTKDDQSYIHVRPARVYLPPLRLTREAKLKGVKTLKRLAHN